MAKIRPIRERRQSQSQPFATVLDVVGDSVLKQLYDMSLRVYAAKRLAEKRRQEDVAWRVLRPRQQQQQAMAACHPITIPAAEAGR